MDRRAFLTGMGASVGLGAAATVLGCGASAHGHAPQTGTATTSAAEVPPHAGTRQTKLVPYRAAEDTWVIPAELPVISLGRIVINSYVIKSKAGVTLIDTHMPVVRQEYLEALGSLVDPKDVRWIFLTHDDGDHTGALMDLLNAAPRARFVTQFIGFARLETAHPVTPERVRLLNPGQSLDVGDRRIVAVRPPVFDSPATTAFYDSAAGVLFSSDSFGAFIPSVVEDVDDVPAADFARGFEIFNRGNHPWSAYVDRTKFARLVGAIRDLHPKVIASSHAPIARGRTAKHLEAMLAIGGMEPLLGPDQAAFDDATAAMRRR